jgi:hypothetical protein
LAVPGANVTTIVMRRAGKLCAKAADADATASIIPTRPLAIA